MKLTFEFPDERDFGKVQERFYQVAASLGFSREDALRRALLSWLKGLSSSDATLEVTDAEWEELCRAVPWVRERHRLARRRGPTTSPSSPESEPEPGAS